ncbi:hypothetical protein [Streptomyces sp. TR06-5]|uniref:hypothetical protein n=1 Tax=unclassified Streptomyces TaxID=2593676 RepID=UPI0039A2C2DC
MEYLAALTPPLVMAIGFTALVVTIVKNQGGMNKAKEDAAVDAAALAGDNRNARSVARDDVADAAERTTDG